MLAQTIEKTHAVELPLLLVTTAHTSLSEHGGPNGEAVHPHLVLQNGIERPALQRWLARSWHRIDAVFVGGDDEFKLGEVAEALVQRGAADGKWIHWGRVNSRKRMKYCIGTGACDSMDGSSWAQFRDAHLDKGLAWLHELANEPEQLRLAA
jgi:hypothetical protein